MGFGVWEGDGREWDPRMREDTEEGKRRFHGGMLAEEGELGQWEDVSEGGVDPGGEIPCRGLGMTFGLRGITPILTFPPQGGREGEGRGVSAMG